MTRFVLMRKTIRDLRMATIAIATVIFLIALIDVLVYPQYKDALADFQMPEAFQSFAGEAGSIASPEGFLSTEFFSWVPLLLITLAIIGGTGAIAGEEAAGTLDMLLAQPLSRTRLLLEKMAGLVFVLVVAALVSFPAFVLGLRLVEMEVGLGRVLVAVLNMLPVALLFLSLSLWGSASLPNRGAAAMVAAGAVVVAYFLNALGASVALLETPRKLSPFYWSDASRVLIHGFDWARAGGLLAVAAVFLLLALRGFARREIATGPREWGVFRFRPGRVPRHRPMESDDETMVTEGQSRSAPVVRGAVHPRGRNS